MGISKLEFWKILVESRLLTDDQCRRLSNQFAKIPGKSGHGAKPLAVWLVRQHVLSKYQATILLSGRAGPFLFGEYRVHDRVEGGRLAGWFRAVHLPTSHPVLLKFMAGTAAHSAAAWDEMVRWLPLTIHSHVSRCYEAVHLPKYKFLAFEDLHGDSLREVLERSGKLAAHEASRVGRAAALALAQLHRHGRMHGDVRLDQLWLDPTGHVKLLVEPDIGTRRFDLSKAATEPDGLARADCAAPELAQPGRPPDALSDIYALGCSLYHLVTGRPPFEGGDVRDKLRRHATESIQSLDEYGAPAALTRLIAYAMAKNPAVRCQQSSALAEQLALFAGPDLHDDRPADQVPTAEAFERWLGEKTGSASPPVNSVPAEAMAPVSAVPRRDAVALPSSPLGLAGSSSPAVDAIKRRAKMRRRNNLILAGGILAILGALFAAVLALQDAGSSVPGAQLDKPAAQSAVPDSKGTAKPVNPSANPDLAPARDRSSASSGAKGMADLAFDIVPDDGRLLWAPPTAGGPIDLRYVPAGAQLLLVVRPAELSATDEGRRVLRALGPRFESARSAWEASVGVSFHEMEQLIVAFYGNDGRYPRRAYVVRTAADLAEDELLRAWGQPAPIEGLAGNYYRDDLGFYVPAEDPRTFVMGPLEPEMMEAAARGWNPPPLRREMAELLHASDSARHVTLLFAPSFLTGDGQELLAGQPALRDSVVWFLGDGLKAGLVSLHVGDNLYVELRIESDIQIDRHQLASQVRERLSQIPEAVELYIAQLNPPPYWRLVANRYPGMIRLLHQQSRVGLDGRQAVVNAVLPGMAAHNLVFGGEMLLAFGPGESPVAAQVSAPASGPDTIEELLKSRISMSFSQDSLESAMQNVAEEVKTTFPALPIEFKIKILGPDLEKDGITRNQQVRDYDERDKTVAEVLTAMVRKANPITTVKDPSQLEQKLIWVVGSDPENPAHPIVLVTTRTGAELKEFTLPEVFRPK